MSVSFDPKFIKFDKVSGSTLLNGLMAYYKLDETSGTNLTDTAGVAGTAVLSASATVNNTGKLGKCVDFTANTSCITMPSGWASGHFTDKISVSMWVNPDTLTTGFWFFCFRNAAEGQVVYATYDPPSSNDWITFACLPTSPTYTEYSYTATSLLSTGSWQHLVFVNGGNGSTLRIYLNGTDVTGGTPFAITYNFDTLNNTTDTIGNQYPGDPMCIDGKVDEVGVWDRALTGGEITSLYNSGTGRTHPF
jgi:hypothetical protein